jgi:hypothetical protein
VVLLHYEEISERRFGGWTMGQVNVARINTSILLKYAERAELDPYSVSGVRVAGAARRAAGHRLHHRAGLTEPCAHPSRPGEPRANSTAVRSAEVSS